ncbi:hypothetical protein CIPAW_04G109200 [Carya illinoinensis]|uniref:Uncharacterized protein n=1 Tax=Carya illinoinensis TaxID=32201 RepID=A0A8T1QTB7_CARIL|nr:hypothetical protein CIPAW_04G109200 [Carya illinoinensis]
MGKGRNRTKRVEGYLEMVGAGWKETQLMNNLQRPPPSPDDNQWLFFTSSSISPLSISLGAFLRLFLLLSPSGTRDPVGVGGFRFLGPWGDDFACFIREEYEIVAD